MELVAPAEVVCPHCGETFTLQVDTSQPDQSLIEDCPVCCRPIHLSIHSRPGAVIDLSIVS
jgi:phage terminase large subunit GpA-like protein